MEFTWEYQATEPKLLRTFLKEQGMSKKLLAKVKFQGGKITVNQKEQNVLVKLAQGEKVTVMIPDEGEHETLLCDETPIDIIFEDEHFLLVNKPAGVASIPSQYHPNGTMANRVKAYYCSKNYANRVIHVVTRLDRDTTGLMLFAKHGFAHALLDQQLRSKKVTKKYLALVSGDHLQLATHAMIEAPIARDMNSLLKRQVLESGKFAQTEYWCQKHFEKWSLVEILLHTGRTHQIRVHFSHLNCALLGDELYGGNLNLGIKRQALHCYFLAFEHPFEQKHYQFEIPLPKDMAQLVQD